MVGIVIDATKLRRTQEEFGKIFENLCGLTGRNLRELKSTDMLPGKRMWQGVDGGVRSTVIENICYWVSARSHKIALAAVDRSLHRASVPGCPELRDEWQAAAVHVLLQLQRYGKRKPAGKGRTVVVIDNNPAGVAALSQLVVSPPLWTDAYYGRARKEPALSMIIDTPFAVESHHVLMIQVADVIAGILRRSAELETYASPEKYAGERVQHAQWTALLSQSLLGNEHRWGKGNKSECAEWYRSLAPESLLALK
jgi:hypothetical protein